MDLNKKIYVAGHTGLLGSALMRRLKKLGAADLLVRSHQELDLGDPAATDRFFRSERPDYVFLAADRVGGIAANVAFPADYSRDSLKIQVNVLDSAWRHGCQKFLLPTSSCIYPKFCPQPIKEEYLLTGALEETNDSYAAAKIAGLMLGRAYARQYGFSVATAMSSNSYGPGDNFHATDSHVIPGLMRRFHEAKEAGLKQVAIWGSGRPLREFLFIDDLADACVFLMQNYEGIEQVNIGSGQEISTRDLAGRVAAVVGYEGEISCDPSQPDGIPRKLLDSSKLRALGWQPSVSLDEGLKITYDWYTQHLKSGSIRR